MVIVNRRCPACGGQLAVSYGEIQCFLCSRPFTVPRVAAPAVYPTTLISRPGRTPRMDDAAVAARRAALGWLPWGSRGEAARAIGAKFGLSANYIRQIAYGYRRTG